MRKYSSPGDKIAMETQQVEATTNAVDNGSPKLVEAANANEATKRRRGKYATKDTGAFPIISFNWSDGTLDQIDVASFPESVMQQACLHGFSQKLGDSYAAAENLAEAKALFAKQLEAIRTKGWTARVEAGEREEPYEILAQAIYNTLVEDGRQPDLGAILAKVKEADRKVRNQYRDIPRVAYHIKNIKAKGDEVANLGAAFGF